MQVVLIAAVSLDGRITRPGEAGAGFASPEDQVWFRGALHEFDCTVMGRVTFDTIPGDLPPGRAGGPRRLRIVMTRRPENHAAQAVPGLTEFTADPPAQIVERLRARNHRRCALLGGGQIYQQFLDADLVDALWLTLEPVVLGHGGTPFIDGAVRDGRCVLSEMRLLAASTILLDYRRTGREPIGMPPP